jgi:YggT family protein
MEPFANLLLRLIDLYKWILIIAVVMSWLSNFGVINTRNQIVYQVMYFLDRITEPALRPIRRLLPNLGGIDISPVILILVLIFVQEMIISWF